MNNTLLKTSFVIITAILIFCHADFVLAQGNSFLTTINIGGFAEVANLDQATAKKEAVRDAIRKAVEEVVEASVSPEVLMANYSWISSVYSNAEDSIHSYQFLSESFDEENNIYSVILRITLYSRYIQSLLDSKSLLANNPNIHQKVLFIIRERGLFPSSNEDDFWERIPVLELFFAEKLQSVGVEVIGREALRDSVDIGLFQKSEKGDTEAAIQVGFLSDARIVITGNAVARKKGKNPDDPARTNYQANVSLKAYLTETGKILGAGSEFMTITSDDHELGELNAFRAVGEKIFNNFINGIIHEEEISYSAEKDNAVEP